MTDERHFLRNLKKVVLTGRNEVIFTGGGPAIVHPTDQPAAWSGLLQRLTVPQPLGLILEHGAMPLDGDEDLLQRLVAAGHLLAADDTATLLEQRATALSSAPAFHLDPGTPQCRHLLVGCTGSVVAGLMAQTFLSLRFSGFQDQLDVVLTDAANRFVTRELLEAYGIRCWQNGFERQDDLRVPHVTLAATTELICVLPATADALDRIARSACSDLLSLTVAASKAPVVLAPVMNATMWNNAGVQRNVDRLRADGRFIIEPTIIFGAADFGHDAPPMYGGHGTLWSGPLGLIKALSAVLVHTRAADPHPRLRQPAIVHSRTY